MSNSPPNPIHSHPEGPPEYIPLREYVEGRLSRLLADASERTDVLRELYDREIAHVLQLFNHRINALDDAAEKAFETSEKAVDNAFKAQTALIDQRFAAMDKAVEKALTEQKENVSAALAAVSRESSAHAEAHEREHRAQAVAIDKAEKRSDERFEEGNNFRQQIESERQTYARVDMLNVTERNARQFVEKLGGDLTARIEKLDNDIRLRMEKLEFDSRARMEKIEGDLRQRIEVEAKTRSDAIQPLSDWRQRSAGQVAVWIGLSTVALAVIVFIANWATTR